MKFELINKWGEEEWEDLEEEKIETPEEEEGNFLKIENLFLLELENSAVDVEVGQIEEGV